MKELSDNFYLQLTLQSPDFRYEIGFINRLALAQELDARPVQFVNGLEQVVSSWWNS